MLITFSKEKFCILHAKYLDCAVCAPPTIQVDNLYHSSFDSRNEFHHHIRQRNTTIPQFFRPFFFVQTKRNDFANGNRRSVHMPQEPYFASIKFTPLSVLQALRMALWELIACTRFQIKHGRCSFSLTIHINALLFLEMHAEKPVRRKPQNVDFLIASVGSEESRVQYFRIKSQLNAHFGLQKVMIKAETVLWSNNSCMRLDED